MIDKKLLSEVLGKKIEHIIQNEINIDYCINGMYQRNPISIYELADKCKEWIYDKGYGLFISIEHPAYTTTIKLSLLGKSVYIDDNSNTEPEAIFKACEWLYKEIWNG